MLNAVLAALLLATAARAQNDDPLAAELASRPGMSVVKRVAGRLPMGPAQAVLFSGPHASELAVFVSFKGRYLMIDTQTGARGAITLDETIKPFSDPWPVKGQPAVATLALRKNDSLGQPVLGVLRYKRPYFERAGDFPLGHLVDVDGDGLLDVVSRPRPLGRFFSAGCGRFEVTAGNGYSTEVFFFERGRLVKNAGRAAAFLERRLKKDQSDFAAAEDSRSDDPGGYLGKALTVYFDLSQLGRKDEGWSVVQRALEPPAIAPPGLSACLAEVREKLRERLHVGE